MYIKDEVGDVLGRSDFIVYNLGNCKINDKNYFQKVF